MTTTTNQKHIFKRHALRVSRTHEVIERLARRVVGPIGAYGMLLGERRLTTTGNIMSRAALEQHLVRRSRYAHGLERLRMIAVADEVRASPTHLAPIVIATTEGRVILQWLEELPS